MRWIKVKKLTAFGLAILGLVAVGQPNAKAADFKKLYGTWVSNGEPPNSAICKGLSYEFTAKTQTVHLSGGPGSTVQVTYVDGGGQRIGVYGNTGQPLIFNLVDDNHIQLDGLPSCISTRQK
jgi:hypothetical protein